MFQSFEIPFHWGSIIYLALVTTFLANPLYTIALISFLVGSASILATIEPVVGVVLASVIFGDVVSFSQTQGLALIISGVVLVTKDRRTTKKVAAVPVKYRAS